LGEEEEDYYLSLRLDQGKLFTLQILGSIVGLILTSNLPEFKERITNLLNQEKKNLNDVKKILSDYAENVGGGEDKQQNEPEKKLLQILQKWKF